MSPVVTVFMLNVSGFTDLWDISGFFCNLVTRRKQETEWHHIYYDSNQQCNWNWHTCSFCKLLSCLSIMEQVITCDWLRSNSNSTWPDKYWGFESLVKLMTAGAIASCTCIWKSLATQLILNGWIQWNTKFDLLLQGWFWEIRGKYLSLLNATPCD